MPDKKKIIDAKLKDLIDKIAMLKLKREMTKPVIYSMLEEMEKEEKLTSEEIKFWYDEIPKIEAEYDGQIAELEEELKSYEIDKS